MAIDPSITIVPVAPTDFEDVRRIGTAAFANDAFHLRAVKTDGTVDHDETIRAFRAAQFDHDINHPPPTLHYIKAVSASDPSQTPLGFAKWIAPPSETTPKEGANKDMHATVAQPKGMDTAYFEQAKQIVREAADLNVGNRRRWHLVSLATDPSHVGKGIASALVRYGTSQADAQHLESYVEGSSVALGMYRRAGFVECPESSTSKGRLDFEGGGIRWCMIRPPADQ